jgi:uncharacterized protein YdeI (YjbR/CyaY-like superfamily)
VTRKLEPRDVLFAETPAELRAWFDAHHATADELWLGYHKRATGQPTVSWSEAVDEALCVGWIDSIRISLDDERSAQRFTPRRKGSNWSAINVAKIEALRAQGRMRPAGEAAYADRTPERTGVYSYERPEAAFDETELARLRDDAAAWQAWEASPPGYRRGATAWVTSAKRPETRERRLTQLIEASAAGTRPAPFLVSRDPRRAG